MPTDIMHVVHNLDDTYGGPARSIPELVGEMAGQGWSSSVLSLSFSQNESNELISKFGISWKRLDSQIHRALAYNTKMGKVIEESAPKIIHYHNLWNCVPLVATKASRSLDCPLIMSPRGTLFPWNLRKSAWKKSAYLRVFGGVLFNRATVIHATSSDEVASIKALRADARVALIPNGVDLDELNVLSGKAYHKERLGLETFKNHVLYVGRIEQKKGLAKLIEALGILVRENFDVELLVAGPVYSESYYHHCRSLAESLGLANHIKWLGMVSGEMRKDIYGAANLFVLPTQTENFGMAIAEALSASLPVVTTFGTPWKSIVEAKAGYIVEPESAQVLDSMRDFFGKTSREIQAMSEAARAVSEEHGWHQPAKQMGSLYDWLLGNASRPDFVV